MSTIIAIIIKYDTGPNDDLEAFARELAETVADHDGSPFGSSARMEYVTHTIEPSQ